MAAYYERERVPFESARQFAVSRSILYGPEIREWLAKLPERLRASPLVEVITNSTLVSGNAAASRARAISACAKARREPRVLMRIDAG